MDNHTHTAAHGINHIGGRENNEDAFRIYDESANLVSGSGRGELFCVADGMGGHRGGERASQIAVEGVWDFFSQLRTIETDDDICPLLTTLYKEANAQILKEARRNSEYFNMGSTLTSAVIKSEQLFYAHIGDSRLYHLHKGTLTQLTDDHTIAAELWRLGRIDQEELKSHPQRNTLFSYLGKEKGLTIQGGEIALGSDDLLLLCTDGLTDVLSDEDICDILQNRAGSLPVFNPKAICKELIDAALSRKPKDNVTAVVSGLTIDPTHVLIENRGTKPALQS